MNNLEKANLAFGVVNIALVITIASIAIANHVCLDRMIKKTKKVEEFNARNGITAR
tara:strand:+ start:2506 stop:2673 length:168 start_codon:yes stop_codon:yes gene_type:complete